MRAESIFVWQLRDVLFLAGIVALFILFAYFWIDNLVDKHWRTKKKYYHKPSRK